MPFNRKLYDRHVFNRIIISRNYLLCREKIFSAIKYTLEELQSEYTNNVNVDGLVKKLEEFKEDIMYDYYKNQVYSFFEHMLNDIETIYKWQTEFFY
jgi:hypothetical protein